MSKRDEVARRRAKAAAKRSEYVAVKRTIKADWLYGRFVPKAAFCAAMKAAGD